MKESLLNLLDKIGQAYWIEVHTEQPRCTYYFGPFLNAKEARDAQMGYTEDLEQEGAQGLHVIVKRCKPSQLTIADDGGESERVILGTPAFSS